MTHVLMLSTLLTTTLMADQPAAPPASEQWPWGMRAATLFRPVLKDTDFELEDRIGLLRRLGYDTLITGIQHFPLDYTDSWDELQEWTTRITAVAHRHGMKVIEHHSAGVFHTDHLDDRYGGHRLGDLSPVNIETGEPDIYIKTMVFACPNNPGHWDVYSDYARRMMVQAGVDGYMPDDVEILHDVTSCACKHCRSKLASGWGIELPPAEDSSFWRNYDNADYRRWLRFRQESVGGFHRRMRQLRDEQAPHVKLLTCQCEPAGVGLPVKWALAHDEIADDMDVLFLEACNTFGYFTDWAFWACDAKLLQAMGDGRKPVFPLFYPKSVGKPYLAVFSSPEAQARSRPRGYYSNEVAKSTGAYERVVYDDPAQAPGHDETMFLWGFGRLFADGWWVGNNYDLPAPCFSFEDKHRSLFRREGSVADIALHYSRQTRDFYGGLGTQYHVDAWRGWATMLLNANRLFDVVVDEQLERPLPDHTELLILPNSACLTDAQVETIRGFVNRGGRVIATGDTSLYDGCGERRAQFALADVLGIGHRSTLRGVTGRAVVEGMGRPLARGLRDALALADDVTLVEPREGTATAGELQGEGLSGPLVVMGPSGRSLYMAAKPGFLGGPARPTRVDAELCRWAGVRVRGWDRLAQNAIRLLLPDAPAVSLANAPKGLIMSAARNNDSIVVQLLNATGATRLSGELYDPDECPFPPVRTRPGREIELRLRGLGPVPEAYLMSPDAHSEVVLAPVAKGDMCIIALPAKALSRYALVVLGPAR